MQRWCVVFCFFCRQKTAYEMRIRDWSSDVCSSDLLVPTESEPAGTAVARRRGRVGERNRRRILSAAEKVFARRGFRGARLDEIAVESSLPKANPIGRAPCRERVCPYV